MIGGNTRLNSLVSISSSHFELYLYVFFLSVVTLQSVFGPWEAGPFAL